MENGNSIWSTYLIAHEEPSFIVISDQSLNVPVTECTGRLVLGLLFVFRLITLRSIATRRHPSLSAIRTTSQQLALL